VRVHERSQTLKLQLLHENGSSLENSQPIPSRESTAWGHENTKEAFMKEDKTSGSPCPQKQTEPQITKKTCKFPSTNLSNEKSGKGRETAIQESRPLAKESDRPRIKTSIAHFESKRDPLAFNSHEKSNGKLTPSRWPSPQKLLRCERNSS